MLMSSLNHSIVTLNEVKSLGVNSVKDLKKIGFKRDSSPDSGRGQNDAMIFSLGKSLRLFV